MSEPLWLIPLFFFAIATGFFLGRREGKRRQRRRMDSLSQEYVAGLNFLLNEEPDKAVQACSTAWRSTTRPWKRTSAWRACSASAANSTAPP